MGVRMREVPGQVVVTEQRMVDQGALERWLPEAMARVHKAAGDMAAGTAEQPYLLRGHAADEPVFIVIYEGNPNEEETAVECCTPLRADAATPDGAAGRTIPAHREAYVRAPKARSQLSLKALRLYERLGVLRPVAVDPGNGSRRYHESQLYTARLTIMLRLLD